VNRVLKSLAVLPAAGRSRRMGRPKLLLPWQGRTVIEHVLDTWLSAGVRRLVVVVHPQDTQLAEVVRGTPAMVEVARTPPADMKASVRLALERLEHAFHPREDDPWLLAPADMPQLEAASITALLASYRPGEDAIVVPRHARRRGHPVLFPWPLAGEVSRLADDEGVNALLQRHRVREIEDPSRGVLSDLDTPEDYRRIQAPRDAR